MKQQLNDWYKNAWKKLAKYIGYIFVTIAALGLIILMFIPELVGLGILELISIDLGVSAFLSSFFIHKHFKKLD
jgi:hypothetical protein